jgi:hypothetical protein
MLKKALYKPTFNCKHGPSRMLKEPSFALIVSAKTIQEKFLRIP